MRRNFLCYEYVVGAHPENLGISDIVAGPDGNLWFTVGGRPRVGKITTTGQATEFALPDPAASPSSIAVGADGNLWFAEFGLVTGEPACINSCRAPIADLAEGPDGKLWFAAGVEPGTPSSAPGTIGTYAPPPLEIRIVGDPSVQGGKRVLPVRCRFTPAGRGCDGRLRLYGPGKLGERHLRLRLGASKQVALRLPKAVARGLERRGRVALRVTTDVLRGKRDTRRIVVRRP